MINSAVFEHFEQNISVSIERKMTDIQQLQQKKDDDVEPNRDLGEYLDIRPRKATSPEGGITTTQ